VGKRAESKYSSGQLRPVSMNKMVKGLARRCLSEADAERFKFKSLRDAFHDAANRVLSVRGENRIVNRLMGQSSGANAGDKYAISEETMREPTRRCSPSSPSTTGDGKRRSTSP